MGDSDEPRPDGPVEIDDVLSKLEELEATRRRDGATTGSGDDTDGQTRPTAADSRPVP